MIVTLPVFKGDVQRLRDLLSWIRQLGGCPDHRAVIVADAETPVFDVLDLRDLAAKAFKEADIVSTESAVAGWPQGPNALFLKAAKTAEEIDDEWLFLEPDATPLCAGWLDAIDMRQRATGARYMGALVPCSTPGLPPLHMDGVAVYPPYAHSELAGIVAASPNVAFDISTAEFVCKDAVGCDLFQSLWGEKDNPPRFASKRIPKTAVFDLDYLNEKVKIFHRCKDGSLIKLLRRQLEGTICVVFAFCGKDSNLMLKSLQWMSLLCGKINRSCVLHFDETVNPMILSMIRMTAESIFNRVIISNYATPKAPWIGWPAACNFAFVRACEFIDQNVRMPWLWFEADAVALVPDWIEQIDNEYVLGGKLFMGTIFPNNTHMNGVGVYPVNTVSHAPCIGHVVKEAWDFKCGPQIIKNAHQAAHLIQHYDNGREMGPPVFTKQNKSFINPTSVVYHAVKNDSLINLLISQHV